MKRTVVAAGLMGIAVLTMASKCGTSTTKGTTATTAAPLGTAPTTAAPASTAPTTPAPTAPPTTPKPTVPPTTLSLQVQNAIRAAHRYLALGSGFSRTGLIQQLSSPAGDGYPVADATFAVDSLDVDWNAQAVLAAKGYLRTLSFSCSTLVQQLDSAAGSQFTVAEAEYGAKAVGLC